VACLSRFEYIPEFAFKVSHHLQSISHQSKTKTRQFPSRSPWRTDEGNQTDDWFFCGGERVVVMSKQMETRASNIVISMVSEAVSWRLFPEYISLSDHICTQLTGFNTASDSKQRILKSPHIPRHLPLHHAATMFSKLLTIANTFSGLALAASRFGLILKARPPI
jgi:hypothetical protein